MSKLRATKIRKITYDKLEDLLFNIANRIKNSNGTENILDIVDEYIDVYINFCYLKHNENEYIINIPTKLKVVDYNIDVNDFIFKYDWDKNYIKAKVIKASIVIEKVNGKILVSLKLIADFYDNNNIIYVGHTKILTIYDALYFDGGYIPF